MQPVVPLWVTVALAFLAPIAALVGVVIGAVTQRRTTRLQVEAARERDRELWAREDRHRFAEQKRIVYADFISEFSIMSNLTKEAIDSITVVHGREWPTKDGAKLSKYDILEAGDYRKRLKDEFLRLSDKLHALELIATVLVREKAESMQSVLLDVQIALLISQDANMANAGHGETWKLLRELQSLMRTDLAPGSAAT